LQGKDITGGAKFYHTKKVKPHWRKKVSYVGDFGDHIHYIHNETIDETNEHTHTWNSYLKQEDNSEIEETKDSLWQEEGCL
jgi:hypothetical protein